MNYLQLVRTYPGYIAYGMLHYFFSGPGQSFFIALFAVHFKNELGIDSLEFDSLYAGATLGSAIILPLVGRLLDRVKLRFFSLSLGTVFMLFCFLASLVTSQYILFIALVGLRLCGQGLMPLTGSTAIARYFDQTRGKALSLIGFGVSFSEIILPIIIVGLIAAFSWQTTWVIIAISILVIFIPGVIFLVPNNSPFQYNQPGENKEINISDDFDRKQVLKDPRFYTLLLVYAFIPFFVTGIFINNDLLAAPKGWTEGMVAIGLTIFGSARLVTNFAAGPLIDRFSAKTIFAFQILPTIPGIIGLMLGDHPIFLYFFFATVGISTSFSSITNTAIWAEIYGVSHLGSIRSIVASFMTYATALGPIVMGWGMKDAENLSSFYIGLITLMVFLSALGFWQVSKIEKKMI